MPSFRAIVWCYWFISIIDVGSLTSHRLLLLFLLHIQRFSSGFKSHSSKPRIQFQPFFCLHLPVQYLDPRDPEKCFMSLLVRKVEGSKKCAQDGTVMNRFKMKLCDNQRATCLNPYYDSDMHWSLDILCNWGCENANVSCSRHFSRTFPASPQIKSLEMSEWDHVSHQQENAKRVSGCVDYISNSHN